MNKIKHETLVIDKEYFKDKKRRDISFTKFIDKCKKLDIISVEKTNSHFLGHVYSIPEVKELCIRHRSEFFDHVISIKMNISDYLYTSAMSRKLDKLASYVKDMIVNAVELDDVISDIGDICYLDDDVICELRNKVFISNDKSIHMIIRDIDGNEEFCNEIKIDLDKVEKLYILVEYGHFIYYNRDKNVIKNIIENKNTIVEDLPQLETILDNMLVVLKNVVDTNRNKIC